MQSNGRRASKPRGFTLIEILVVVAIIALLVGILLPSLSRARAQGRRAQCLSNLHQIGLVMYQYAVENKDVIPRACDDGDPSNWTVATAKAFGYIKKLPTGFVVGELQVQNMPIFHCPERMVHSGGPFLDFVVNAMDPAGPRSGGPAGTPQPAGNWEQIKHFSADTVDRCKLDTYPRPAEVIYLCDAEREDKNIRDPDGGRPSLAEARVNHESGDYLQGSLGMVDVWQGKHLPEGKLLGGNPETSPFNTSDAPGYRRAARKMHMKRWTLAAFMDGHATGIQLANRGDHTANYAYWLRLFGVEDPVTVAREDPDMK